MLKFSAPFPTAIFICTHKRPAGHPKPCCADRGAKELRDELKDTVRDQGLESQIRVFQSGCLGACEQGPIAVQYPDGELMMGLEQKDLAQILADAKGK